jgi:hypothetical protein
VSDEELYICTQRDLVNGVKGLAKEIGCEIGDRYVVLISIMYI